MKYYAAFILLLGISSCMFARTEALEIVDSLLYTVFTLLSNLLSGKGVVVSSRYSAAVFVHADIAAHIVVNLHPLSPLLAPVTALVGSIAPLGSIISKLMDSSTVLNIRATADVKVTVDTFVDVRITAPLPSDATPIKALGLADVNAVVGVTIGLSAQVDVAATLVSPVLDFVDTGLNRIALLRLNDDSKGYSVVPAVWNKAQKRLVADISAAAVSGTYIFVNVNTKL